MTDEAERHRRWQLLLGSAEPGELSARDRGMDAALAALYDAPPEGSKPSAGLGGSSPSVARWLGDIRSYFPNRVVQVMQRDAVDRLGLTQLLLEPELLGGLEPDVHLVSTLISLKNMIPEHTRSTARQVVAAVVTEVERRIAERTRSAVRGALARSARTRRPRHADIDWPRTITANLRHYLPEYRTVVPERLVGYGRRRAQVAKELVVAIDQSGSMAESVVYAAVFGAVLTSIRALRTSLVAFDTEIADLTAELADPVDLLFGVQLGGGTDINRAVAYCQNLITRPADSIFVLISDLYEGGVEEELVRRMASLHRSGVQCVALLALSDSGTPSFDRELAARLVELGIPAFACTPDAFPDLLAAAMSGADLLSWGERYQDARSRGAGGPT